MADPFTTGFSALSLISSWLDQQDAAAAAGDANALSQQALNAQLKMALQQMGADNALRDRVIQQTGAYQTSVSNALNAMGPYGSTLWDEKALASEFGTRYASYRDAADDAITELFGTQQADMMRMGMDASTLDIDMRAALADKAAELHSEAYTKAKDDALGYVTNLNTARWAGLDQMNKMRIGAVNENQALYEPAMKYLASMITGGGNTMLSNASYTSSNLYNQLNQQAVNASAGFGQELDDFFSEYGPSISDWLKGSKSKSTTEIRMGI
jgi:hypothetical protein